MNVMFVTWLHVRDNESDFAPCCASKFSEQEQKENDQKFSSAYMNRTSNKIMYRIIDSYSKKIILDKIVILHQDR